MGTPMQEFSAEERKAIFKRNMAAKMLALKNAGELDGYLTRRYGEARYPTLVKGHEMPGALNQTRGATEYDATYDRPGFDPLAVGPTGTIEKVHVNPTTGTLAGTAESGHAVVNVGNLRLNAGWIDMHDTDVDFTPNPAQNMYLWIIREDGHLILGIEEPGRSLHGFAVSDEQRRQAAVQGLGHPTLAAMFKPDGTLDIGKGRIGGELHPVADGWKINSASGRYSGNRGDLEVVMTLLQNAADVFRGVGVNVCQVSHKTDADGVVVRPSPPS